MNIQQLEYIIAVDRLKSFTKAAQYCNVTQATLSAMIKKLEEELDVIIFDRKQNPIHTTDIGLQILSEAIIIQEHSIVLKDKAKNKNMVIEGHLKIGIIPTLAPYLLPLFLLEFIKKYPAVRLSISELTTQNIIKNLRIGALDAGILATPLSQNDLLENVLFNEEFVAYVSKKESIFKKKYLLPADIDVNKMWLLEEGHCLRSQALNLCALQKTASIEKHLDYEIGSIETLKKFVEKNEGITLLPALATIDMSQSKKAMLRYFKSPAPIREISIVTVKQHVKTGLLGVLKDCIMEHLPNEVNSKKKTYRISLG
jgi:LysR family transcriptional regulator, hydrogen peroxide-inducible genes activator